MLDLSAGDLVLQADLLTTKIMIAIYGEDRFPRIGWEVGEVMQYHIPRVSDREGIYGERPAFGLREVARLTDAEGNRFLRNTQIELA